MKNSALLPGLPKPRFTWEPSSFTGDLSSGLLLPAANLLVGVVMPSYGAEGQRVHGLQVTGTGGCGQPWACTPGLWSQVTGVQILALPLTLRVTWAGEGSSLSPCCDKWGWGLSETSCRWHSP